MVVGDFTAPGMWHLTRDSLSKALLVLDKKHPKEVKDRDVGVELTSVLQPKWMRCLRLLPFSAAKCNLDKN